MSSNCNNQASCVAAVLLLSLSLFMSACRGKTNEPTLSDGQATDTAITWTVVYQTDSTEWIVYVFKENVYASDDLTVPAPFRMPTHEEAQVLRHIQYGASNQRYLTDDGYTFGMPSASVSKAGSKTTYGLMGLYIRPTTIYVSF